MRNPFEFNLANIVFPFLIQLVQAGRVKVNFAEKLNPAETVSLRMS